MKFLPIASCWIDGIEDEPEPGNASIVDLAEAYALDYFRGKAFQSVVVAVRFHGVCVRVQVDATPGSPELQSTILSVE